MDQQGHLYCGARIVGVVCSSTVENVAAIVKYKLLLGKKTLNLNWFFFPFSNMKVDSLNLNDAC